MADEFSQIDDFMNKLSRAEAVVAKFGEGSKEAKNAMRSLGLEADDASASLRSLASAGGNFVGSLAQGNSAFTSFSGIVDSSTSVIKEFADKFGIGGKVVGQLVDVAGKGVSIALAQYDMALQTFQNLSQVGVAGVDGIDELRQNMVEAGVPMEMFARMIAQNNDALVGLTGSADQSSKAFGQMMSRMRTGIDHELRMLGFSTEEIGETLSNFANLQRRLGNLQQMDQAMLTEGAIKFGKELDEVAKLTGQSRTEQQKTLEAAMREGRYLAAQRQMQQQGDEGEAAANEVQKLMLATSKISPALSAAIKDISGGFISTVKKWTN